MRATVTDTQTCRQYFSKSIKSARFHVLTWISLILNIARQHQYRHKYRLQYMTLVLVDLRLTFASSLTPSLTWVTMPHASRSRMVIKPSGFGVRRPCTMKCSTKSKFKTWNSLSLSNIMKWSDSSDLSDWFQLDLDVVLVAVSVRNALLEVVKAYFR